MNRQPSTWTHSPLGQPLVVLWAAWRADAYEPGLNTLDVILDKRNAEKQRGISRRRALARLSGHHRGAHEGASDVEQARTKNGTAETALSALNMHRHIQ